MIRTLASLCLLGLATAAIADDTIVCESRNHDDTACYIGRHREVELSRQLSNASCDEGEDWWIDGANLVVSNGCRGEFDVYDGRRGNQGRYRDDHDDRHGRGDHDRDRDYGNGNKGYGAGYNNGYGNNDNVVRTVVCESTSKRAATCAIGRHGEVRLSRQLSDANCSQNRDWWVRGPEIQVANGCRAEFTIYPQ